MSPRYNEPPTAEEMAQELRDQEKPTREDLDRIKASYRLEAGIELTDEEAEIQIQIDRELLENARDWNRRQFELARMELESLTDDERAELEKERK